MGSSAQATQRCTPQEYYALEREAPYKSEYYNGEIFAMSGGTWQHSRITANVVTALNRRLTQGPCSTFDSNLRLKIKATGLRTYPDTSVYCDKLELDPDDAQDTTACNPTVLIEVPSKSTEAYDRGEKFNHFRQIETLKAYVLVSQWSAHVEVFERMADGSWNLREAKGLDATIAIPSIRIELPLAELFDRVAFVPRLSLADE